MVFLLIGLAWPRLSADAFEEEAVLLPMQRPRKVMPLRMKVRHTAFDMNLPADLRTQPGRDDGAALCLVDVRTSRPGQQCSFLSSPSIPPGSDSDVDCGFFG